MIKRMKMRSKLILIFIITALIPMIALSSISYLQSKDALTKQTYNQISMFSQVTNAKFNDFFLQKINAGGTLGTTARVYNGLATYQEKGAGSPEWQATYSNLDAFIPEFATRFGIEAIFITDLQGKSIYASGNMKTAMEGADLSARVYVQTALSGTQNISEFMYSKVIETNFVAIATPIKAQGTGEVIGTINALVTVGAIQEMLTKEIGLVGQTADVYLIDEKGLLNTNPLYGEFKEGAAFVETIATHAVEILAPEIQAKNKAFNHQDTYVNASGTEVLGGLSVVEIGGTPLGMVVEINRSEALAAVQQLMTATIILVVCVVLFSSVVLLVFIERSIRKPIDAVVKASARMSEGDLDINLDIKSHDEIGVLSQSFLRMTQNINEVMSNINSASEQVASGSRQVSDTSMALSQGATEQASSIEELTASIQQIAAQTRLNAENAKEANILTEGTRTKAGLGNGHMNDMLQSMSDINDSSTSISKIIKVIDEIAFQTNILALNAAVEAARAGDHGKGFAVVAEEVRNLAARSANAAKETTALIEGSITKVADGTKIANQTAHALSEIVESIQRVSTLVGDIAVASEEQALSVDQINLGISQIADVVQTTSATSEETAAASEELSSQAELLKSQVSRFNLRRRPVMLPQSEYGGINPDIYQMLEQLQGQQAQGGQIGNRNSAISSTDFDEPQTRKIILNNKDYGKY